MTLYLSLLSWHSTLPVVSIIIGTSSVLLKFLRLELANISLNDIEADNLLPLVQASQPSQS